MLLLIRRLRRLLVNFFALLLLVSCSPLNPQPTLPKTGGEQTILLATLPVLAEVQETFTETEVSVQSCLLGIWEVDHLEESLAASYLQSDSMLLFDSVTGMTHYRFDQNGLMTITFDNLVINFNGVIEGKEITARNTMVGEATAVYRYNEDLHEIVLSTFGGDGIQFILEINGQVLANGNFPAWRAFSSNLTDSSATIPKAGPTRIVHESHAAVNCQGNGMTLQAVDPLPGPAVYLRRVGQ